MNQPFHKLTVIGLGLIGSSVARGARIHNLAHSISVVDTNELSLIYARKHEFADQTSLDASAVVGDSDIIVIAAPTHALADICKHIAPHLQKGTLVMDTGSVKQVALAAMQEHLPQHALIVPAHPIAGSEESGVMAGREDLFDKKRVIVTPGQPLTHAQLARVTEFWQSLGARVEAMPAALHDTVYGYVSHLPQLLAFAVAPLIAPDHNNETLARFLRITRSNKYLWTGIFMLNRDALLAAGNRYLDVIAHIRRELAAAPAGTEAQTSERASSALLPRIVASCLITTVMEAEKKAGLGFIRFSGPGFADFTLPATTDPEGDMEQISAHYAQLTELMDRFSNRLKAIIGALEQQDAELLLERLE